LAEIAPVVLLKMPLVFGCTSTEMKHDPLALGSRGCCGPPRTMAVDCGSCSRDAGPKAFDRRGSGCNDGDDCMLSGRSGLILINPTAGPRSPPVRVTMDVPGEAATVPSQLLLRLLGLAITRPTGKLSVIAIPVRVMSLSGAVELLLGLLMVKLNRVIWFWLILSGRKSLLMVGGKATPKVADAVPPVPPSLEFTAPVVFR